MADTLTLDETSSHEDIESAVDQIIADQAADESVEEPTTEETSDAELLGEDNVTTERDTADEKETLSPSGSEKTGKAKPDTDWREEAVAEASAFGFSDEDIADFQSREEFDRAMKLFDRQMDFERTKLTSEGEGTSGKTEAEGKPTEAPKSQDGRYDIQLDRDVYDDDIVDEFTRMRDHYESRLTAIEDRFQSDSALAAEDRFDRTVDDIGVAELLGKTGEESSKELERRKELFNQIEVEQAVLQRMGRPAGDYKALVLKTARSLFSDEFDKKLLKNHTRRISRQSNGRQGGGATRPTDPAQTVGEEMRQLYKELEQQAG